LTSKGAYRGVQRGEIVLNDPIDLRRIDAVVLVREKVAKTADLPPRDLRTSRLRVLVECLDGFAEDQQVVEKSVSPEALIGAAVRGVRAELS